ncbi:MAG: arylesterase [Bacteroidota bacterium]
MSRLFHLLLLLSLCFIGCNSENSGTQEETEKTETQVIEEKMDNNRKILFYGNSLTYGYGLTDRSKAFPYLIQARIDSLGMNYDVVNQGESGATSADGLSNLSWVLQSKYDVMVLALGANDGLRGIDPALTRKNIQEMIDIARTKYPEIQIVLAGMKAPPNMGSTFTMAFETLFPELAMINQTALIPFLLEGVAGEPNLNLPDGIHPNPEGHIIVAENVWRTLGRLLEPGES